MPSDGPRTASDLTTRQAVPAATLPGEFDEARLLRHIRKNRWVSLKCGGCQLFAFNWAVSLLASLILWIFVIVCATMPVEFGNAFRSTGQPWITQNMTWLYVITQDVWAIFLIWVCFSKYGKIKLGKDDEKPQFNDLTWFCMLFCSGIAVGFYFYGVYEPMSYYRQPAAYKGGGWDNNVRKPGFDGARAADRAAPHASARARRHPRAAHPPLACHVSDDDQRANQSIFLTIFHWGFHGWVPYVLLALNASLVSHRWGLPMTIRSCFYPLIGNHIYSVIGDIIDALSMTVRRARARNSPRNAWLRRSRTSPTRRHCPARRRPPSACARRSASGRCSSMPASTTCRRRGGPACRSPTTRTRTSSSSSASR